MTNLFLVFKTPAKKPGILFLPISQSAKRIKMAAKAPKCQRTQILQK
jgi:hypothetical protein